MPSKWRGRKILWVDEGLNAVFECVFCDGKDGILDDLGQNIVTRIDEKQSYGGMGNKVGDGDELSTVGIDKGLKPFIRFFVLDLDNVGQSN